MQTVIILRRVRDFGESLSDTIQFLKQNWKKLLVLYLVFAVPFLLIAVLVGANAFADFFQNMGGFSAATFDGLSVGTLGSFFGAIFLYLLSACAFGTAIYLYMKLYEESGGRQPEVNEIGKLFFPKLLANLGYTILAAILLCFLGLIAIIPFIGILIVFFGFFYIAVALSLLYPINTIENNSFGTPLQRCFKLIRSKWWYTFGFLIILTMIYYFFSLVISMIVNLIFGISAISFIQPNTALLSKQYFLITGFSAIIQQVFYLLVYVGVGINYYSLREEKEGTGLDARLDQLGTGGDHGQIEEHY